MNMKRNKQGALIGIYLMVLAVTIFLSIGGWYGSRWVNWNYGYSADAKAIVCEMVKPEALVDPSDCE